MTGLQKERATSGQFPAGQDLLDVCAERSLQFPGSHGQGSGHARFWPTPRPGWGKREAPSSQESGALHFIWAGSGDC